MERSQTEVHGTRRSHIARQAKKVVHDIKIIRDSCVLPILRFENLVVKYLHVSQVTAYVFHVVR